MIIDAHVHIGKSARLQISVDGEFLVRVADELGFDKICCTDLTALFYDMHEGNRLLYDRRLNHEVEVIEGILESECTDLLTAFFRHLRAFPRRQAYC